MNVFAPIKFDNSYARLPDRFYVAQLPVRVSNPSLIKLNEELAIQLGMDVDFLQSEQGIAALAGNELFEGSTPIAQAYAGHQFAYFQPQLGDGRANLLGEVIGKDGKRFDLQLKGAGPTAFSRNGDGRSAIGPVIREYIVSEAMHKMGVPTTRALAMVKTGDVVYREEKLPGAVLTRVASSHIRVGTFQFFAAQKDMEALKILADHAIVRHFGELFDVENKYEAFLKSVIQRQASLIAKWMGLGFIHGVMNTDNVSVAGETLDYGPCAFMNQYDPATVYSFIDKRGRYAYGNQPHIAQWNLARFAEAILPLLDENQDRAVKIAETLINAFPEIYHKEWNQIFSAKIGISVPSKQSVDLAQTYLELMQENEVDFTLGFRLLGKSTKITCEEHLDLFSNKQSLEDWISKWRVVLNNCANTNGIMDSVNPVFIPRNHLIEDAIASVVSENDFQKVDKLHDALKNPFIDNENFAEYASPPALGQDVSNTFCGT